MPRGRATTFDAQRDAMLAQAARLFATRGYAAASMADLAAACGVSKALLYHYYRDKAHLLADIAEGHVERLEAIVDAVEAEGLGGRARLERLLSRFVAEYAHAQDAHRVLTEDLRFLDHEAAERIRVRERRVVAAFASCVAQLRPDLAGAQLHKPLVMLLFGMINWTYKWMRPDGALSYDELAPLAAGLFLHGLEAVTAPERS